MTKKKCTFKNQFGIRLQRATGGLKRQEFNEIHCCFDKWASGAAACALLWLLFSTDLLSAASKKWAFEAPLQRKEISALTKGAASVDFWTGAFCPNQNTSTCKNDTIFYCCCCYVRRRMTNWKSLHATLFTENKKESARRARAETNLMRVAARHWINIGRGTRGKSTLRRTQNMSLSWCSKKMCQYPEQIFKGMAPNIKLK